VLEAVGDGFFRAVDAEGDSIHSVLALHRPY
jgi:hypothetical protein